MLALCSVTLWEEAAEKLRKRATNTNLRSELAATDDISNAIFLAAPTIQNSH